MTRFFGVKIRILGKQRALVGQRPVMYLSNHRSWADFFIDVYLLAGQAMIMSRRAVFFAFPIFMSAVVFLKGVLLFNRTNVKDKTKFNEWIDEEFERSPLNGILVYPEGHRNTSKELLPLRRGMLHYAHSRKMLVQLVTAAGKEEVLSEKDMKARFGRTVVAAFSPAIDSAEYEDVRAFIKDVEERFREQWASVCRAQDGVGGASSAAALEDYCPGGEEAQVRGVGPQERCCYASLGAGGFSPPL